MTRDRDTPDQPRFRLARADWGGLVAVGLTIVVAIVASAWRISSDVTSFRVALERRFTKLEASDERHDEEIARLWRERSDHGGAKR
ncbi:MAG: hypothetical protein AAF805_02125 [Planctomycetota bacterium]